MLGVDDWALKRGQRYGTILLDLERHRVIDLLPDREAATLAAWLTAHPGVELISRDRGGAHAEGTRQGAPDAIQIADRFHLVKNLMEALEHACTLHQAVLRTAAKATHPTPLPKEAVRKRRYSGLPHNRPGPTTVERQSAERRARRLARYEQIVALRAAGMAKTHIARTVGLDRRTVSIGLAAGHFRDRVGRIASIATLTTSSRVRTGCSTTPLNSPVSCARAATRALIRRCRVVSPNSARRAPATHRPPPQPHISVPVPSPRETVWFLRNADAKPEKLTAEERAYVTAIGAQYPALARARTLVTEFVQMLAHHEASALAPWLAAADESELRPLAAGLSRDHDAVLAAVLFSWSNGQVEGQVNRVKLLKRSMYGRASFQLLRQRVLHAA